MQTIARDIMSSEILSVSAKTTVEEALKILVNNGITGFPVVDPEGKLVGIYSDFDLLNQIAKGKDMKPEAFASPIQFSKGTQTISETTTLMEIIQLLVDKKFRRLPVVDKHGKLVGIVTRRDLMRALYYRATLK